MVLGARPIGSRTIGDGTGDSGLFVGSGISHNAEVVFAGVGTFTLGTATSFAVVFAGVGTLAPTAAIGITWSHISLVGRGTFVVAIPPRGKHRRIIAVDQDGTPIGSFGTDTVMGDVTWALNEPDDWSFALPANNDKAALVHSERLREAQLWRGDQLLSWGPMSRPEQTGPNNALTVRGKGAMWYFMRRFIGKADRTTYVINGSFEEGLSGWDFGYSPAEALANRTFTNVTVEVATDRAVSGIRSLKMTQANPTNPLYGLFASQTFLWSVDPATNPDGDEWAVVGRCWIVDSLWAGPQKENVGLGIERLSTTETVLVAPPDGPAVAYPKPIEARVATITDDTPRDTWVTLSAALVAPVTGVPEYMKVSLAVPHGAIYWDRIALVRKERLAFFGVDQALIVKGIGEHLQDAAYDKSDLNIGFDCPLTGVTRDRIYVHDQHPPGGRSMMEFTDLANGVDVGMRYSPTERTLYTSYLGQGRYQPNLTLRLGKNIASYTWAWDGDAAANSIIALGEGVGATREEGFAEDPTIYANDTTLERVENAPQETPIDSLDARATEMLTVVLNPDIVTVVTVPDTDLIGRLGMGDTTMVDIREGELVVNDVYRVVRMSLHPNDSMTLTLNKRSFQ